MRLIYWARSVSSSFSSFLTHIVVDCVLFWAHTLGITQTMCTAHRNRWIFSIHTHMPPCWSYHSRPEYCWLGGKVSVLSVFGMVLIELFAMKTGYTACMRWNMHHNFGAKEHTKKSAHNENRAKAHTKRKERRKKCMMAENNVRENFCGRKLVCGNALIVKWLWKSNKCIECVAKHVCNRGREREEERETEWSSCVRLWSDPEWSNERVQNVDGKI